jgi:ABC-type antimicrobial peptide transport system permease subunit
VDSNLSVNQIQTLNERLARNTAGLHFIANLFMLFGLVAMILAATGIYAVMCNLINQRTQEIGLRMAMGATESNLLRMAYDPGRQAAIDRPCHRLASGILCCSQTDARSR